MFARDKLFATDRVLLFDAFGHCTHALRRTVGRRAQSIVQPLDMYVEKTCRSVNYGMPEGLRTRYIPGTRTRTRTYFIVWLVFVVFSHQIRWHVICPRTYYTTAAP